MGIATATKPIGKAPSNKRKDFDFRSILRLVSIIIPIAVLGNIIYAVVGSETSLLEKLAQYDLRYLSLAIVLVTIPLFCHTIRMLLWSRKFDVKLKPVQSFKTALIADIGSAATPTMVGGGYIKLFFLIGYGFTPGRATLLMVLGSLEDILFFTMALPVVIYFTHAWDNPYVISAVKNLISHWPVLLGLAAGISLIIYLYNRKKKKCREMQISESSDDQENFGILTRLVLRFKHYKNDFMMAVRYVLNEGKSTLILATIVSGVGWSCRYASINFLILGLGYDVDPLLYTLLHWVVFSTMTMIPTPGAIGGAEISFGLVFSGLLPAGIIPIMTGVWRFVTYYMVVAVGAIYIAIVGPKFPRKLDKDIPVRQMEHETA